MTANLPDLNQTPMTPANDGYEMVEEVEGWPPAEVLLGQCTFAFAKNPMEWDLVVGRGVGLRLRCFGSWGWGCGWDLVVGLGLCFRLHRSRSWE